MAASWRRIYQFPYLFQLVFVFALMRVLAISVALNRRILDPHRWVYDPHYPIPPIKHVFFPELYGTGGAIIMAFQYIGMFLLIDVSWIFGRRADCKSHLYGYAWRCVIPLVLMSVVERFVVAVDGFQVLDVVPVCIGTCALSFVIWPIQRLIMSNRDSHIDAAKRVSPEISPSRCTILIAFIVQGHLPCGPDSRLTPCRCGSQCLAQCVPEMLDALQVHPWLPCAAPVRSHVLQEVVSFAFSFSTNGLLAHHLPVAAFSSQF